MIQEFQLRALPEQAISEQALKQFIGREKGLDIRTIHSIRVLKRSIDARQRTIYVNLKVRLYINEIPHDEEFVRTEYRKVENSPQVIVVGAGPGGLFAALRLIELGLRPIVVERGKNVRDRKTDIARISREHKVDPESNYSFGEGGAGAYSDGKLYTRSKKRGNVDKILNVFCQHGASSSILVDAHPHIGTDKLPRVIENMRNTIIDCGGEVHFETRMDSLIIEKERIIGIETNTGKIFKGPVILATGHSARDVYRWLHSHGVQIETKGIAVGVRLEHPSMLIDQIQYHNRNGRGKYLPAAEYSFVTQVDGRGVYSFCMNPYALFLEAMEHAVREIDLQDYDADGDGYVDNVHIVFAGYGEEAGASPSAIWSHEAMFPEITMQGMKIDRYSCTPELRGNRGGGISRIGPCCHEMGHALGAMDYYDTDYTTGGSFEGTGVWDVMAQGSWNNDGITPVHFNPYVKAYDFGWVGVTTLTHTGDYSLHPSIGEKDGVYRVDTGSEGDFYLLESRVRDGFDTALPGEGLMVYHVHPRIKEGAYGNTINASAPQMMYPVCASSSVSVPSSSSYSYGEINSAGCLFPGSSGKTEFGGQTVPAALELVRSQWKEA